MEFHNRIVEHWLLPGKRGQLGWQPPSIPPATGRTIQTRHRELAEFMEYNWATCPGTGGAWGPALIARSVFELPSWFGAAPTQEVTNEVPASKSKGGPSVSDELAFIKAAFGMSISQLAAVLRVQRPTIYSWFDDESGPGTLRAANRKRLISLHKLAEKWNAISKRPLGSYLMFKVTDKKLLFDLLAADDLNERVVEKTFDRIGQQMLQTPPSDGQASFAQRLRKKGFSNVPTTRRPSKGYG